MMEPLNGSITWKESIPVNEGKVKELTELNRPDVSIVLGVLTVTEAEVEKHLDQVINVVDI